MIFNIVFGIWLFLAILSFGAALYLVVFCKNEGERRQLLAEKVGSLFFISLMILTSMAITSKFV